MMYKTVVLSLLFLVFAVPLSAQGRHITGSLRDAKTGEIPVQIAVQLFAKDSTYIAGTVSGDDGRFALSAPEPGEYMLKFSSVGYVTQWRNIAVTDGDKDFDTGRIKLKEDAIVLAEITKTAQAMKVVVVEDTFIYNSAAYRTPEGRVVEELVKRLPGATVDDDGNVTINGKAVERVKVDGREFMTGDTKTAIKNLPTSIIDKVKAYSDKSDNTKMTGIDDGEEVMTLDFDIKPGMNKGLLGNIDLAYGTRDRYAERGMLAWMKDKVRVMAPGNFNNTNDMGFGGRGGGFSRGRNGLNTSNMTGVNINYEDKDKLKIDGSIRWNHNTNDASTRSSSEQFVTSETAVQSFANNISQSYSKDKSFNAQARIEWKPDTMTTVMFRPSWSWSDSDGRTGQGSATFASDPYAYSDAPLDDLDYLSALDIIRNSSSGSSLTYGITRKIGGQAQITRRFGSKGRNVSLRAEGNYSSSGNKNFSTSNVLLYGSGDDYSINRYSLTPAKSRDYALQGSYSEPVAKKTYIQLTYRYAQSYSRSTRTTYDFSDITALPADYINLLASLGINRIPAYRDWRSYLPDDYSDYIDTDLCRYSEYRTSTHTIELQLRRIRDNYNFNVGVQLQPQHTTFRQNYLGLATDTARNVINIAPTINFRYYFSRQHQLRLQYRGTTSQPEMSDLVSVTDDSDPLNVTLGNPGLKPSFKHNLYFNYNNYISRRNQVIELHGQMTATRNAVTRRVTYDSVTGGRTTRPENIDGNWDASIGGMYNISLDTLGVWNINSSTDYSFNNYVGLVSVAERAGEQRNVTRSHSVNERLAGSFRNDWIEIEIDGTLNYTGTTNRLQPSANLDTWGISYGISTTITCPWGMSVSSDFHVRSRRGYTDSALNTNEPVWNAQIGQSFLSGKRLTVTLQWYDILRKQSNLSRTISAMERRDTEYNAINSYGMLHVIYRFNVFGTNNMPERHGPLHDGRRPDFRRDEFRPRGGEGGPPGGGMPPGL
ncbi:MAG: outer membrane beta-barrel protein [Prevotella sp.]|nr:outer membrane beta-barrel protein [Prevotella sp.]